MNEAIHAIAVKLLDGTPTVESVAHALYGELASLYLTASVTGAAHERDRVLKIVHAIVDNAAGDTTLGQNILKKIKGQ